MNRQRIPNKMILTIAGVSLLFLGAFPQILWASNGDRLLIKGTLGDLNLVFANQLHGRHQPPPPERPHYRGKAKHRRPVVTTTCRDHRRPAPHRGYGIPWYQRHPQPKHYYRNKHRNPRADHYDWNRWNRR